MREDEHDDEIAEEMPEAGGAPCGDIFHATDVTHVTDADADIVEEDAEG